MSNLWEKIIKEARRIKLTERERAHIRANVMAHMRGQEKTQKAKQPTVSPYYFEHFFFALTLREKRFVPVIVFLILILGGGTSFAANYALPGEALYTMKLNVNETVESWLALSPDATVRFEAVKAERRLKEIEKITIKKKKLSAVAKAQVKENFDKNAKRVKEMTAEIAAKGDIDKAVTVRSEFEDKLAAHSVVLNKLSDDESAIVQVNQEDKENIQEINALVDAHLNELKSDNTISQNTASSTEKVDIKEKKNDVENKDNDLKKKEESVKTETSEDMEIDILDGEPVPEDTIMINEPLKNDVSKDEGIQTENKPVVAEKIKNEPEKQAEKIIDPKIQAEVDNILKDLKAQ